ncbi:hypothetical protein LTR37_009028 [Vermiconidia calcicola]|uniref:Uncharacterized protein n=1 Tax=Vermiconidia calcicola TaxID=1690605 RepID=A0ACC3N9E4_9PEZI|nr:hypothetical protein LTR37_009028 [Vermiconidia calcicola]
MAIGTLNAKLILDEPQRDHYGINDPISGNVVLTFEPSTCSKSKAAVSLDLFGPLKIAIVFHGRAHTKISTKHWTSPDIYHAPVDLFSAVSIIFEDSFRAEPRKPYYFPFTLDFPKDAELQRYRYEPDDRFDSEPGVYALPPSFNNSCIDFANHYESQVEYRIGVDVSMPSLRLDIRIPHPQQYPRLKCSPPQTPSPINSPKPPQEITGRLSFSNELLLAEADRPTGLRQRAKAALTSDYAPVYNFDWILQCPHDLHIGQPLVFDLRVRIRNAECTATLIPSIHIHSFAVELVSHVTVRGRKRFHNSLEASSNDIRLPMHRAQNQDSRTPFSKSNDWSKTISTDPLPLVSISFKSFSIQQTYHLKINGAFTVAEQRKSFARRCEVSIHPPLQSSTAGPSYSSAVAARSSTAPFDMSSIDAALPEYERPPEYDEAATASLSSGKGVT